MVKISTSKTVKPLKESQPMEEKQRENTAYYGIFTNALKIQHTSK